MSQGHAPLDTVVAVEPSKDATPQPSSLETDPPSCPVCRAKPPCKSPCEAIEATNLFPARLGLAYSHPEDATQETKQDRGESKDDAGRNDQPPLVPPEIPPVVHLRSDYTEYTSSTDSQTSPLAPSPLDSTPDLYSPRSSPEPLLPTRELPLDLTLSSPASPTTSHQQFTPEPEIDITRLNLHSGCLDVLYSGAVFEGKQASRYDVTVTFVEVDLSSSFLCGHLKIRGLTQDLPELTTYFDAEIIGERHGFITQNWGATEFIDMKYWSCFPSFENIKDETKKPLWTLKDSDHASRGVVFMRWKERFLVPSHRAKVNGADITGFYYMCVQGSSNHTDHSSQSPPHEGTDVPPEVGSGAEINLTGWYYQPYSDPWQELRLKHVPGSPSASPLALHAPASSSLPSPFNFTGLSGSDSPFSSSTSSGPWSPPSSLSTQSVFQIVQQDTGIRPATPEGTPFRPAGARVPNTRMFARQIAEAGSRGATRRNIQARDRDRQRERDRVRRGLDSRSDRLVPGLDNGDETAFKKLRSTPMALIPQEEVVGTTDRRGEVEQIAKVDSSMTDFKFKVPSGSPPQERPNFAAPDEGVHRRVHFPNDKSETTLVGGRESVRGTVTPSVRDENGAYGDVKLTEVLKISVTGNKHAIVADITNEITLVERDAVGTGGFCDLFVGSHSKLGKVALKRPRFTHAEENVLRRFRKEAELWCTFDHRCILPFLGMAQIGRYLYLVSPWIRRGNLSECLINKHSLDRLSLICDIAEALLYLHGRDVVHGDVKCQNVLVTDDGHAMLCDFGLTKILDKMITSTEVKGGGSTRYIAPELILDGPKTRASNVYAFSMTMVEIISGKPPFSHIENNYAVMMEVGARDGRPHREPTHSREGQSYGRLWELIEMCWVKEPALRPDMKRVLDELRLLRPAT